MKHLLQLTLFVTGSADGSVKLWDTSAEHDELIAVLKSWERDIKQIALSQDGSKFVTWGDAHGITVWDTKSSEQVSSVPDTRRDIKHMEFATNSTLAVSAPQK